MNSAAWCLAVPLVSILLGADDAPVISAATVNEQGFLVHQVESPYQDGMTQIRVLIPEHLQSDRKYPAIYVLPVEAKNEARYGDGLVEVKKHDLHNKQQVIFVAPTVSHLPWYADHPTEPTIQQETYFLQVVVPFVEKTYPVQPNSKGRFLLGFSKSGWGAWSLLMRHPDFFGKALAWDAPLMMDRPGKYGSADIFGTQENFDDYRLTDLLRSKSKSLGPDPRLILTGFGNFRADHELAHSLMDELSIPHEYVDGPPREHTWHSGWLPEAVEMLLGVPPR